MAVLCWSILTVAAAFILHLALWRIHLPQRQTRALLGLFFGVLALVLAGAATGLTDDLVPLPRLAGLPQYVQTAIFVTGFTLAYIITYSALEADSPTLVMIKAIAEAGAAGLPVEKLLESASDDVLLKPRLADLVRDGMLVQDGSTYQMTPRGRSFVQIFIYSRRILGAGKGG